MERRDRQHAPPRIPRKLANNPHYKPAPSKQQVFTSAIIKAAWRFKRQGGAEKLSAAPPLLFSFPGGRLGIILKAMRSDFGSGCRSRKSAILYVLPHLQEPHNNSRNEQREEKSQHARLPLPEVALELFSKRCEAISDQDAVRGNRQYFMYCRICKNRIMIRKGKQREEKNSRATSNSQTPQVFHWHELRQPNAVFRLEKRNAISAHSP